MSKKELVEKLIKLGTLISESSLLKMNKASLEGLLASQQQLNMMQEQMNQLLKQKDTQLETTENPKNTEAAPSPTDQTFTSIFDNQAVPEDVIIKRKLISSIPDDTPVRIMNGTCGKVYWISPVSGMIIDLPNYGSTDEIAFKELKVMRNRNNQLLKQCSLIILDQEVADALDVSKLYDGLLEPSVLEQTVLDYELLEKFFEKVNKTFVHVLISTSIRLYHQGKLHDARTIKLFEDKYNLYLEDTLPQDDYVSSY